MSLLTNLVSYWKLDESSGNANDSFASNTLTNVGSVTYNTGLINNGIDLGSANTTKYLNKSSDLLGDSSFTISLWVKLNTELTSDGQSYEFFNNTTTLNSYHIYYDRESGTKLLHFRRATPGTGANEFDISSSVSLGTSSWHQIVVTYDGTTGILYLDNTNVVSTTKSGNGVGTLTPNCTVGASNGNSGSFNSFSSSHIDEVGIWTRAITSGEVTTLWNSGAGIQYPFGVPETFSVSDSTTLSDTFSGIIADQINKSDTTNMSESSNIVIFKTDFFDEVCSMVVSGYKWLTATLLSAQQRYAVRPFFQCRILDDTIQPNQIINGAGTQQPVLNGSSVTAPDGSVLAAGFDVSNNISFFKSSNLHTLNGGWDSSVTLDSSGASVRGGASQRVIITCSDWINGSYHIDVFYFNNFHSGSDLNVIQKYSDDGGVTWNTRTVALTGVSSNNYPANNLSLAAFKPRLVSGVVNSGFLYIKPNGNVLASGFTCYDIVYSVWAGSSFSSQIVWTSKDVNSNDWTLHSLDCFYLNGVDYVLFSGFRNFIDSANVTFASGNYSIWITSFVTRTQLASTDIMSKPIQVFSSSSVNAVNQNSFIYPVANVVDSTVNIVFRAITVASVSQSAQGSTSQVVTTNINYMLTKTMDGLNFTYPSIIVFSDGTQFTDINPSNQMNYNSYTNQGIYYYLLGSGMCWEFIQNNTLADITNDVVQYSIQDTAGQPSTVTLQLANQNNMWYPNGTNSGASAVAKNKKILLQQGFYNTNGVAETVPRNTYFIDDIVQSTDFQTNNVTITARDLYKKLKTTITKYSYGWVGPFLYADIFDGSTLSNWSQISGSWNESSNTLTSVISTSDSVVALSSIPTLSYGSFMTVNIIRNLTGTQYIYGFFLDANNWLRLEITDGAWAITKSIAGVTSSLASGSFGLSSSKSYMVYVRRYDYYKFNFMLGQGGTGVGNDIAIGTSVFFYANGSNTEFDMTADLIALRSQSIAVALGTNNVVANFQFFKYSQYDNSNSISDLIKSIATKAGITSYDIQNTINEEFTDVSTYTGTFTSPNNSILLTAGNKAVNTDFSKQISNGEIVFTAKLTPYDPTSPYGFTTIFRSNNAGAEYYWHIKTTATGGYQSSRFERLLSTVTYPFPAQMSDETTGTPTLSGNNNFDLTKLHTYRLVMVDGWMFGFIDGVMVNAWNDNNTTANYLTTGYWGWSADSNTKVQVYSMKSNAFWKQVGQFSLNPGDDMENGILSLIQSIRGWIFSDLMGTLKTIFLGSSDSSTYTYQNQIFAQGVDTSDKEFVSQVTVFGDNVSAVARNTVLMAGRGVRDEVIVDYTIKTQQDAQTRANNELINANQYQSQYNPKQTMNVGAEIFDPVTVVDTGNNTSGVNSTTRVYTQKFTVGGGGGGNEYSLEIDTGVL